MHKRNRRLPARHRRGAMLVFIAVCLPLLIIMAAFAIDVAWMQLARTELRTATDSAARAGAKELSLKQDATAARTKAKAAAARNYVAGEPLLLADNDIQVGKSVQIGTGRFNFTNGGAKPNAIKVWGKRTNGSKSGPVDLMFSKVLGVDQFEPVEVAASTQLDRDICLVVDRSGSMMWTLTSDNYPKGTKECDKPHPTLSRWGALATSVDAFLTELTTTVQDEHVSLVSYSSNTTECSNTYKISQIDSDLVSDYSVIRTKMTNLSNKPVKGSTAISAGLDDGIKVLTGAKIRPFAVKTIILMTDGVHNLGREPVLAAQDAAKKDITIHTITFSDDADIKRMEAVAAAANGKHFHATTQAQLTAIFKEIAATLPVLTTEQQIILDEHSPEKSSMEADPSRGIKRRRKRGSRLGATAAEFAITAPLFVLFLLASFEFGWLNVLRHTSDNAAYEAARYAMVPGGTAAEAIAKANSILNIVGARGAVVKVSPSTITTTTDEVKVTIDIPLKTNALVVPKFTKGKTLHSEATMRTERAQ